MGIDPISITAIAAITTSVFSLGLQLVQSYKLIKVKSSCCEMEMKSELSNSSSSSSSSTTLEQTLNENDINIEESPDTAENEENEEDLDKSGIIDSFLDSN